MLIKRPQGEQRTPEELHEHYEIEKELANRLRRASKQERLNLYSVVYDELYKRVLHHPQLTRKSSPQKTKNVVDGQIALLRHFLNEDITFLEIGAGDCALSFEVARSVKKVYAVDVSEIITKRQEMPENFHLILSNGCNIPLPPHSVDIAYSNQLMEHLHPDDAREQLENVYRVLVPGGIYICITPNRLSGPHDISVYFDHVATGFHLKEYTKTELSGLFNQIGFSKVSLYIYARGLSLTLPILLIRICEGLLTLLPFRFRREVAKNLPFRPLLENALIGTK